MERLDRTDFRNETKYITGRLEKDKLIEHFRLEVYLTDTITDDGRKVIKLFRDGLYIVNPNYNWNKCKDIINTDSEREERFIYVETAEVNCSERLIIFSNGDGWGYLVDFDSILGVGYVTVGNRLKAVILTTYGEWIDDLE